jgi:peptidoglycan/xylan/chitin deacetylase (PgdA/CDA1 family)
VAVTFDDGYADALVAHELLARHGVPATFFVTTGPLAGSGAREFWWDRLARALLAGPLPRELPGPLAEVLTGAAAGPEIGGAAAPGGDEARLALYRAAQRGLRRLAPAARDALVDGLLAWAGVSAAPDERHRRLVPDELCQLAASELVAIGAHSVSHPVLAVLPVGEQRREVRESRAQLEALLGRPVDRFAYPFGLAGDWSDATEGLLREEGFRLACTTVGGPVTPATHPLRLPRHVVSGELDGDGLARKLRRWQRSDTAGRAIRGRTWARAPRG